TADGGGIGEAVALIVREEVSLAAPEFRRKGTADGGPEAIAVRGRQGSIRKSRGRRVIVAPGIRRAHVGAEVVLVYRSVKLIRPALGDHLDLAASRAIEVGGLVARADLELLDTFHRCGNHSRGDATRGCTAGVTVAGYVRGIGA